MLLPPLTATLFLWSCLLPTSVLAIFFFTTNKTLLLTWHIFSIPPSHISLSILLDPTSLTFASIILLISANVLQFASIYIKSDPFINRFTSLVILFVLSILILIFLPHLIFLLLGWDGLGITSFLLVIYFQNPKSLAAGIITALINRVGDALILLTIGLLLNQGHWIITSIFIPHPAPTCVVLITIAAMTKSAQIPFSSWLPAAMAAPTPVSALVHSSTLVTAGVFLLIRFFPAINEIPILKPTLLLTASLTMLMAGLSAITECDLKKIIALSTLRQLGLIIATIALNIPTLATLHLFTHALFKALLFVSAGTIIHYFAHSQDLRKIGHATSQLPITTTTITIANLALCGTPFLSGFYSKDTILEIILFNPANILIISIFFLATALTAAYATRFTIILLWSPINFSPLHPTQDENPHLTTPIIILTSAAIIRGASINWIFSPATTHPSLPPLFKLLPLLSSISGLLIAWLIFSHTPPLTPTNQPAHTHLSSMWFLTPLTSQNLLPIPLHSAAITTIIIDHAWLESLTSKGPPSLLTSTTSYLQPLQAVSINSQLLLSALVFIPILLICDENYTLIITPSHTHVTIV